jgi:hypothetical protein
VSLRDRLVIEYYGGGYVVRGPCNESCGICGPAMSQLLDAPSNTWSGLRIKNATADLMYAEFRPSGAAAAAMGPLKDEKAAAPSRAHLTHNKPHTRHDERDNNLS